MQSLRNLQTNPTVHVGKRRLVIQQRLGNGAFGVVYKAKDKASSRTYALKDILCLNESAARNAIREVDTMNLISHQNVIEVLGADTFTDAQGFHVVILTEYCPGGTLNDRLARKSSDELNLRWIRQTAAALSYLHSHQVVHRDLKADNVLLTATEDAKLADFGLAREYIALKRTERQTDYGSWMTTYTQYYMTSGVGPVHWVAPEFFTNRYTDKADVFSLGTLFYAILERNHITIGGRKYYGAFKSIPGIGKVGLGYAMAHHDPNTRIQFSLCARGSNVLQRIAIDAMQYHKDDRPSAMDIHGRVTSAGNITLQASPASADSTSTDTCC